jgi:hypothetical protein
MGVTKFWPPMERQSTDTPLPEDTEPSEETVSLTPVDGESTEEDISWLTEALGFM